MAFPHLRRVPPVVPLTRRRRGLTKVKGTVLVLPNAHEDPGDWVVVVLFWCCEVRAMLGSPQGTSPREKNRLGRLLPTPLAESYLNQAFCAHLGLSAQKPYSKHMVSKVPLNGRCRA